VNHTYNNESALCFGGVCLASILGIFGGFSKETSLSLSLSVGCRCVSKSIPNALLAKHNDEMKGEEKKKKPVVQLVLRLFPRLK